MELYAYNKYPRIILFHINFHLYFFTQTESYKLLRPKQPLQRPNSVHPNDEIQSCCTLIEALFRIQKIAALEMQSIASTKAQRMIFSNQ